MDAPLILRLLAASVKISYKAGAIVRQVMSSGNLGIVDKGVNDLQTMADRQAQACIVSSLERRFPGICVIGEESMLEADYKLPSGDLELTDDAAVMALDCPGKWRDVALDDIVVWVDPLDGTSEYTQGLVEHVTVLIGLSVNSRAIGGVIHQPFAPGAVGRSVYALEGLGCFGFDRHRFSEASRAPDEQRHVLTTTRGHGTAMTNEALDSFRPTEILRVGGCGYKVLLLLEGRCHAYIFASAGCKKWDTCAPEAVLRETGGKLTDMLGRTLQYGRDVERGNGQGVLATANSQWHDNYLQSMPQSIKDHFGSQK